MASHNEGFVYSHTVHSRCVLLFVLFVCLWVPVLHSSFMSLTPSVGVGSDANSSLDLISFLSH